MSEASAHQAGSLSQTFSDDLEFANELLEFSAVHGVILHVSGIREFQNEVEPSGLARNEYRLVSTEKEPVEDVMTKVNEPVDQRYPIVIFLSRHRNPFWHFVRHCFDLPGLVSCS